ncbi:DEAD-domain-containing protein [Cystobasidium minutum MCA 4210]|uniref:DEAD-domain-containing protein n=1 Tax=Cystobasidium minutum MCA 4210 TaxID=1397322 RepID=UPI0034CFAAB7|eukprot:jgi/Rhomi1/211676/estExt_Genemark1.C_5_t10216
MSDLIRTIESDDEDLQVSLPASTSTAVVAAADSKKRKRESGKSAAGKNDIKKGKGNSSKTDVKGKGKGKQIDDEDALAGGFQFDALGGGEYLSRGARLGDAWDVNDMSRLFKKRNAPPRVTVDDIIARRKMIAQDRAEDGPSGSDQDDDEEAAFDSEEELDGEIDGDSDESGMSDEDEESEDQSGEHEDEDGEDDSEGEGSSPDLADDDALGMLEAGEDEVDENEETDSDDEDLSPFAKLANAKGLDIEEIEDEEALNFNQAADASLKDTSYFAKAPSGSAPKISSNEALEKATLPPFSALPGATLSRPILLGLSSMGLTTPTPVQAQTIPVALMGKDIVGSSITGSGKTVAFWVGVLERLLYRDKKDARTRVLVITPTRELAVQVFNVGVGLARYTDIRFCLCVGGLSLKAQEAELKTRPDVLVVTPGRLIDHIRNTPNFNLVDSIEILIIDEADRVLEEGFSDELLEIVKNLPKKKQSMLFSATVNEDVKTLSRLSLVKPVRINIDAGLTTSSRLVQEFIKLRLPTASSKVHPAALETARQATLLSLCQSLLKERSNAPGKTIIFFRSKKTVHRVKILFSLFGLSAEELHGDLTQEMRMKALSNFRDGNRDWLLATDLASRGLDIRGISTVINYSMPGSFEIYLHRVGRTARAGKTGRAITIVTEGDRKMVRQAIKASLPASKGKAKGEKQIEAPEDAETYSTRSMPGEEIKAITAKIQDLQSEIEAVLEEEKLEKTLRQTESELEKGENMLKYKEEILARPKRTWFQSEKDKEQAKVLGKKAWNDKMDNVEVEKTPIELRKEQVKRDNKKVLNHREKRRQEALDELRIKPGKDGKKGGKAGSKDAPVDRPNALPKFDLAVRNAKKAQRPGTNSAPTSKISKNKSKKQAAGALGGGKGASSGGKKRSSVNQKGKTFGKR